MTEPRPPDTHNYRMRTGKHKDELITRVPVSYIKWMANTPSHWEHAVAKAELERRGTVTPTLDVSGHAIDSASLRLRKTWHNTALSPDEGLHAWLCRMAADALNHGTAESPDRSALTYQGIKFVFEQDGCWPVLKTVMPS